MLACRKEMGKVEIGEREEASRSESDTIHLPCRFVHIQSCTNSAEYLSLTNCSF